VLFDLLDFLLLLNFDLLFLEFNDFFPFFVVKDLSSTLRSFGFDFYFFKSSFDGLFFYDLLLLGYFFEIESFFLSSFVLSYLTLFYFYDSFGFSNLTV